MLKKVRKEESQQLDMMDEVDRYEQAAYERRAAAIREKLETQYMRPNDAWPGITMRWAAKCST